MKRILVTGGTGFIGQRVVALLAQKYTVRLFTRKPYAGETCEVIVGDLLRENDVKKAMQEIDCVVHLAAVLEGNEKEISYFNIHSTENIVFAAMKNKVKQFIFLSSENVLWEGQSAYGVSKKISEERVRQFQPHLILRCSVVYGQGTQKNIGLLINRIKQHRVIFIPGDGKKYLQPIFVDDVAQYIAQGIEFSITGTYTIAGRDAVTLDEFIGVASRVLSVKRTLIHVPLWLVHIVIFCLEQVMSYPYIKWSQIQNLNTNRTYDIKKTCSALRHVPVSLQEGLKKTFLRENFYKQKIIEE